MAYYLNFLKVWKFNKRIFEAASQIQCNDVKCNDYLRSNGYSLKKYRYKCHQMFSWYTDCKLCDHLAGKLIDELTYRQQWV